MKKSGKPKTRRMETDVGAEIIRGLREFRETLERGEKLTDRFTVRTIRAPERPRQWSAQDVRQLREQLRASQAIFGSLVGVSVKTIQSWEQGSPPPLIACRLLDCMKADPLPWERMLHNSAIKRAAS